MRARLALLLALVAWAWACSPGFEDPTVVIDLRVLAVVADQPELVLDFDPMDPLAAAALLDDPAQQIRLTTLVADPGQARAFEWEVRVCPPNRRLRCDEPEEPVLVAGGGTLSDPSGTGATIDVTFNIPVDVVMASISADSALGFGGVAVQAVLELWPAGARDAAIFASKRLVVAPRDPPERTPNRNPVLADLVARVGDGQLMLAPARCADAAAVVLDVPVGEAVELEPVETPGVRETYVLPTFDGGVRTITENLRYSWFTTAAAGFSPGQSGGPVDAFGNPAKLASTWRSTEPGRWSLWIVQRDERGGTSWQEYCLNAR